MDAPNEVKTRSVLAGFQAGDIVACTVSGYGWALKGEHMLVSKVDDDGYIWLHGNDRCAYNPREFDFVSEAPPIVPYHHPERHQSAHYEDEALGSGHHFPVEAIAELARAATQVGDKDPAIQPDHYTQFKIQPIRFGVENYGRGVLVTKVLKYMQRAPFKKGAQDMAKAMDCLQMLTRFDAGDKDWWKGTVHFNG